MPAKKAASTTKNKGRATQKTSRPNPVDIPVPLVKWYANHNNVEELRAIIDNPCFRVACAIVKQQNRPTAASLSATDDTIAIRHAYTAGLYDFEEQLQQLTVLPADRIEIPEWDYVATQ